ncbi:MAG TPA: hypothetical protein VGM30_21020 [Puia sp.]|jgi:hypothetical protein
MSLGIIIKAPEGLVLAAESRVTLSATINNGPQQIHVNFDNANKLLTFNDPYNKFGVVTYGLAILGGVRTAQSLIPEFETSLQGTEGPITVLAFAQKLSTFFQSQFVALMPPNTVVPPGQGMIFNVAGFDDNESYGKIYQFEIPTKPAPVEQNVKVNNKDTFGITAGGQNEIMARLLLGYDPRLPNILIQKGLVTADQVNKILGPALEPLKLQAPIQLMPLQDCVNLAVLLIKTTIEAQSLSIGIRGCGGAIDVAIITKNNPLKFIQKKNITVN